LEEKKNSNVRKRENRKDKREGGLRLGEVEFHEKRESDVVLFERGKKISSLLRVLIYIIDYKL
jgi:hypothetical protein